MESLDNYLQPRISISDNVENQYLLEVGGLCPLCGKKLDRNYDKPGQKSKPEWGINYSKENIDVIEKYKAENYFNSMQV